MVVPEAFSIFSTFLVSHETPSLHVTYLDFLAKILKNAEQETDPKLHPNRMLSLEYVFLGLILG
jgi:hypothetical protein